MKALRFALPLFLLSLSAFAQTILHEGGSDGIPLLGVFGAETSVHTLVRYDHGTSTNLLTCEKWEPKPKGCTISEGVTLDDLVSVAIDAQRENSLIEDGRLNQCIAGLDKAIAAFDKIAKIAKKTERKP